MAPGNSTRVFQGNLGMGVLTARASSALVRFSLCNESVGVLIEVNLNEFGGMRLAAYPWRQDEAL
jgi:hypothetical protein